MTCDSSVLATTGPSFEAKTVAYSSRFLATGILQIPGPGCTEHVIVGGFHTVDVNSLYYHPITTTETQKAGCSPYYNPRLSLPAELRSVDPVWATCEPLFYGAFDPPRILKRGNGRLAPPLLTQTSATDAEPTLMGPRPAVDQATPVSATPVPTAFATPSPVPAPSRFGREGVENPHADPIITAKPEHHGPIQRIDDSKPIFIDPDNGALDLDTPQGIDKNADSDPAATTAKSVPQPPENHGFTSVDAISDNVVATDQDGVRAGADSLSENKPAAEKAQSGTKALSDSPKNVALPTKTYKSSNVAPVHPGPVTYSDSDAAEMDFTSPGHLARVTGLPVSQDLPGATVIDISRTADVADAIIAGSNLGTQGDTSPDLTPSPPTPGATAAQKLSDSAWPISSHAVESLQPFLVGDHAAQRAEDGAIQIGSHTIVPGSQATVADHIISVGSDVVVLDGTTHAILRQPSRVAISDAAEFVSSILSEAAITLTSGATLESDGTVTTYTAASRSIISEPTVVLENSTTHSHLPPTVVKTAQLKVAEASASGTTASASSTEIPNDNSAPEMLSSGKAGASGSANGTGFRGENIDLVLCLISAFLVSITTTGCFCFVG